jgi:hypothetical protein
MFEVRYDVIYDVSILLGTLIYDVSMLLGTLICSLLCITILIQLYYGESTVWATILSYTLFVKLCLEESIHPEVVKILYIVVINILMNQFPVLKEIWFTTFFVFVYSMAIISKLFRIMNSKNRERDILSLSISICIMVILGGFYEIESWVTFLELGYMTKRIKTSVWLFGIGCLYRPTSKSLDFIMALLSRIPRSDMRVTFVLNQVMSHVLVFSLAVTICTVMFPYLYGQWGV